MTLFGLKNSTRTKLALHKQDKKDFPKFHRFPKTPTFPNKHEEQLPTPLP